MSAMVEAPEAAAAAQKKRPVRKVKRGAGATAAAGAAAGEGGGGKAGKKQAKRSRDTSATAASEGAQPKVKRRANSDAAGGDGAGKKRKRKDSSAGTVFEDAQPQEKKHQRREAGGKSHWKAPSAPSGKSKGRGKDRGGRRPPDAQQRYWGPSARGKGAGRGRGRGRGEVAKGTGRGFPRSAGRTSGAAAEQAGKSRRPLADLIDYARSCVKTLNGGGASENAQEVELLAARALEEMGAKVVDMAADQRGSRPLERLVRLAGLATFDEVFRNLMGSFQDLASNQYASHVLEAALSSWAERLGAGESGRPAVEPLKALCASLSEDSGWAGLVSNACASHVMRALLLALGGFAPDPKGKGKAAARAGLLPERKSECPADVVSCRHSMAGALLQLLQEDRGLCLSSAASPVVQLLLRVLRSCGDRQLVSEAVTAIVGLENGKPDIEACESLLRSAPGSRTLEAVLECCSADVAGQLFASYFRPRLGRLVGGDCGDFGPFLAQRVMDNLRDEPQLQLALGELDFQLCLGKESTQAQQAVAVKALEACLRLHACLKQGSLAVFRALGLREAKNFPQAWTTLLTLEALESPKDLLKVPRRARGDAGGEDQAAAAAAAAAAPPVLRQLAPAGPQLLGLLLRLPSELAQPLNSGLSRLLEHQDVLGALARETKTAKVLEAALAPSSALQPALRAKLAKAFKGQLGGLGPHPVGGWVCASLWRASLGDTALREAFAKELLAVEDALRLNNFAVWKVCGLHQAKSKQEEWAKLQHKAGKAKRLFDDILEGGDPEAARAAAAARKRKEEEAESKAAVLSDPLVAGLLPAMDEEGASGEEGTASALEGSAEGEGASAAELEELFSSKKRRKVRKAAAAAAAASSVPEAAGEEGDAAESPEQVATSKKTSDDSLLAALELIKGKAPARLKRRGGKRKKPSQAQPAEEDSSDDAD